MATAINPRQQFRYVLEDDRELEQREQTVWLLKPLTHAQRKALDNMAFNYDRERSLMGTPQGDMSDATIKCGLVGWENFRAPPDEVQRAAGELGELIEFEPSQKTLNILNTQLRPLSDRCLDRIHPNHLTELVNAIQNVNTLSVDEGKD